MFKVIVSAAMFLFSGCGVIHPKKTIMKDVTLRGPKVLEDTLVQGSLTVHGPTTLKKVVIQGVVESTGPSNLSDVTVFQRATFRGPTHLQNVIFEEQVDITGSANIDGTTKNKSVFKEDVIIRGPKHVKYVEFKGSLSSASGPMTADHMHAKDVNVNLGKIDANDYIVRLISSELEKLTITTESGIPSILLNNTTIKGDLVFVGQPGEIKLEGASKVIGKIVNGGIKK